MELEQNPSAIGNKELASRLAESRGTDAEVSKETMRRVLDMADCPEGSSDRLLIDLEGNVITDDQGNPIKVGEYLHKIVAIKHPAVLFGILAFVTSSESAKQDDEYLVQKNTIFRMVTERSIEST